MKNKGLIYVLLIGVAAIWYNVFFRVVSNFTTEESAIVAPNKSNSVYKSIDRDTFALLANYRDPFGGSTIAVNQMLTDPQPTAPTKAIVKTKVKESWPTIEYKGLVRRSNSTNPLAIIYIDGIQLHMRKGETVFDGIALKIVHRDSVLILYKKEKRVFWRD